MSKKKAKNKELSIDDLDAEQSTITPDEAAARSQSYEFAGKPLNGFSQERQVAAASMGVMVCSSAFASVADELQETGSYPAMFADAIATVWLCSQPISAAHRAVRKPDEATTRSLRWWGDNGGNVGSERYGEVMETFANIIEDVFTVSAETESSGTGGGKNKSLGE